MTFLQPQGKRRGGARRSEWNRKRRATLGRRRSSLQYSSVEKLVRTTHVRVYHTSSFRPWRAEKPLRVVVVVVVSRPRARFTRIRGNFTGRSSLIRTHHAKERKRKAIEREKEERTRVQIRPRRAFDFSVFTSRAARPLGPFSAKGIQRRLFFHYRRAIYPAVSMGERKWRSEKIRSF